MYFGIKLCLLIVSVYSINLDICNAFPGGPPASACNSMIPSGHATPSGIGAVPHTLIVNGGSTTYATGETITLTLAGTPQFRGFFIQARRVDSTSTRVGSWTAGSGQSTASCSPAQAISHNSRSDKSSETVTFTAPDAATTENIQFYFTVVQTFSPSIYWAFEMGPALTANTSVTFAPLATTTTPAPVDTGIGAGCAVTKTCYAINFSNGVTGCTNFGSCEVFVSFRPVANNTIEFELQHIGSQNYMAVGISRDNAMGMDDVFYCQRSAPNSPNLTVSDSFNPNGQSPNVRDTDQSGITLLNFSISGNVLTCVFTRNMTPPDSSTGYVLDQNNVYTLLLAAGSGTGGGINQHSFTPSVTSSPVILTQISSPFSEEIPIDLVKAHGLLMILAWQVLITIGIFIAAYTKPSLPNGEWFHLHRWINTFGVLVGCIAFILIFVYVGGWRINDPPNLVLIFHQALGLLAMVVLLANPILALFRCEPKTKYRWIFDTIHGSLGGLGVMSSTATIYLGLILFYNLRSSQEKLGLWLYLFWTVFYFLVFFIPMVTYRIIVGYKLREEALKQKEEKKVQAPDESEEKESKSIFSIFLHNIFSLPNFSCENRKAPAKEWPIIMIALAIFVGYSFALYAIMIAFIAIA